MTANSMKRRRSRDCIETKLLVTASRPVAAPADTAEIRAILAEPLDWTAFVKHSMRHGVTAQAFGRLLEVGRVELPPDIAEAAQTHFDHLRDRNRELCAELLAILDALEAASLDVIPLKGPLLAQVVYGDPVIRSCRDLDFLVRRIDFERVIAALSRLGYRRDLEPAELTARQHAALDTLRGQAVLLRAGALAPIEPHWSLVPGNLRLSIDHDGLWRRSRRVGFLGHDVRGLAPEDLVLTIAIHGGKDEWSRLQSLCDLAQAVLRLDGVDWPVVLARAEKQRCLRMLLTGMRLVERLMGTTLPPAMAAACAEHRDADRLADTAAERILAPRATGNSIFEVSAFRYRLHDRWWDRIQYVLATLMTPRAQHFGLIKLPDGLIFLYCPIKLIHDYMLLPVWLLFKRVRAPFAQPSER
jgi:hypothetical protein